jgi:hypothetical protein
MFGISEYSLLRFDQRISPDRLANCLPTGKAERQMAADIILQAGNASYLANITTSARGPDGQ